MEFITEEQNRQELMRHTTQVGIWINQIAQDDDAFTAFLITQGKFPMMSVGNAAAIQFACPEATMLKTAEEWEQAEYKVTAPKRDVKIVIPDRQYVKPTGEIVTGFGLKVLYDRTATDCPQVADEPVNYRAIAYALLTYQKGAWDFMRTAEEDALHGQLAYHNPYKFYIYVKDGSKYEELIPPLLKEVAVADLQLCENLKDRESQLWAAAITLMVCAHFRIPADRNTVMGQYTMEEVMEQICGGRELTIKERQQRLAAVQIPLRRIITGLERFVAKYNREASK